MESVSGPAIMEHRELARAQTEPLEDEVGTIGNSVANNFKKWSLWVVMCCIEICAKSWQGLKNRVCSVDNRELYEQIEMLNRQVVELSEENRQLKCQVGKLENSVESLVADLEKLKISQEQFKEQLVNERQILQPLVNTTPKSLRRRAPTPSTPRSNPNKVWSCTTQLNRNPALNIEKCIGCITAHGGCDLLKPGAAANLISGEGNVSVVRNLEEEFNENE